jgi:peptidoglycan/LPS O-acetylase OafA/YrhL
LLLAVTSYYVLERPLLRLKGRITVAAASRALQTAPMFVAPGRARKPRPAHRPLRAAA